MAYKLVFKEPQNQISPKIWAITNIATYLKFLNQFLGPHVKVFKGRLKISIIIVVKALNYSPVVTFVNSTFSLFPLKKVV